MAKKDITYQELINRINSLEFYYWCDGTREDVEALRKQGHSNIEIWKIFQIWEEMALEDAEW